MHLSKQVVQRISTLVLSGRLEDITISNMNNTIINAADVSDDHRNVYVLVLCMLHELMSTLSPTLSWSTVCMHVHSRNCVEHMCLRVLCAFILCWT
jgi:hypothetical protein